MNIALWSWPQWISVGMLTLVLVSAAIQHGKPTKTGKHDFFQTSFYVALNVGLLFWGGYFR